jgi:hypothetical protein
VVGGPGGQVSTFALQQGAGFPDRVLAAAAVGIGGAARIDDWCPLDNLTFVHVRNGELKRRDVELVMKAQDGPVVLQDDTSAVASVAARVATQFAGLRTYAAARPLDLPMAAELRAHLDSTCDGDLRHVTLAVRVHDSWSAGNRNVDLFYDFGSESLVGLVESSDTRRPVNVVTVDKAGHLAESVTECAYCGIATCEWCIDGVAECPLCSITICSKCRGREALCLACRDLKPVPHTRRQPKAERDYLRGADDIHHVEVAPDGNGFARVISASGDDQLQLRVPLSPVLAQRLNLILQRDVYTGGVGGAGN